MTIDERIDKAAYEFVFKHGIRSWNMDEFSSHVGITKRTLYKYVNSKEQLCERMLLKYIGDIQTSLNQKLINETNFKKGIDCIVCEYPKLLAKTDSHVIKDIFIKYPSIEEIVINQKNDIAKGVLMFIKKAQINGVVDKNFDPEIVLQTIQALVIYYIKNHPDELSEKLKQSINMMVYGIIVDR